MKLQHGTGFAKEEPSWLLGGILDRDVFSSFSRDPLLESSINNEVSDDFESKGFNLYEAS